MKIKYNLNEEGSKKINEERKHFPIKTLSHSCIKHIGIRKSKSRSKHECRLLIAGLVAKFRNIEMAPDLGLRV